MGKNITIQEGGVAKQLTVDKLKTNLVSSGTCLWVPEDEVPLTTKTITENGTYKASDDGYYGFSEVTVNIANAGTATGTDGDGDEAVAYTDPTTGELVEEKVPSRIEVTTPPTNPYGIYQDGQSISTDGMVVKAYLASGGEYGTVPNGEVTLNPTTAVYDPSTDRAGQASATIDKTMLSYPDDLTLPIGPIFTTLTLEKNLSSGKTVDVHEMYGDGYIVPFDNNNRISLCAVAKSSGAYVKLTHTQYNASGEVISTAVNTTYIATLAGSYYGARNLPVRTAPTTENCSIATHITRPINDMLPDIAKVIFDGTLTPEPAGSHQQIGVSWPRPLDGKVLETTFEILVAPGYTPNGEE